MMSYFAEWHPSRPLIPAIFTAYYHFYGQPFRLPRAAGNVIKRIVPVALLGMLLGACASTPKENGEHTAFVNETPKLVELTTLETLAAKHSSTPARGAGEGALRGAGSGAKAALEAGGGNPHAAAGAVLLAPVFAVSGAIYGSFAAYTPEQVDSARQALDMAYTELDMNHLLQRRVLEYAGSLGSHRLVATTPGDTWPAGSATPDYRLHVKIDEILFQYEGNYDPWVTPKVRARAQLMRVSDQKIVFEKVWNYTGSIHKYFDLAADRAVIFRRELRLSASKLAADIVQDTFTRESSQL